MAGYYNTSGIAGTAGNMYGTNRVTADAFKGNDIFGTDYYDTANDGRIGYARFADVLGGNNKFQQYVQSKYLPMYDLFGAASGDDPTMTWTKFLEGQQDTLTTDYAELSPTERGESPGRSLGKLRWL
jgi:hypothetical protein